VSSQETVFFDCMWWLVNLLGWMFRVLEAGAQFHRGFVNLVLDLGAARAFMITATGAQPVRRRSGVFDLR
jgi:hypothetical protein